MKKSVLDTTPPDTRQLEPHGVDIMNVLLPLVVLALDPVPVEVLADAVQHSAGELELFPCSSVELEHLLSHQSVSLLGEGVEGRREGITGATERYMYVALSCTHSSRAVYRSPLPAQ